MAGQIAFLDEAKVKQHLSWPMVIQAVDQAMRSVCSTAAGEADEADGASGNPFAVQPARSITRVPNSEGVGLLFTMPGYIGNYRLLADGPSSANVSNTLACKLVTSFAANARQTPALPTIRATIVVFDTATGFPKAILAATEITTWRTVAASLVATKCLWFGRKLSAARQQASPVELPRLAVVGCGVQGRMHAIGMMNTFAFSGVRVWNRSRDRAEAVVAELRTIAGGSGVTITVAGTVGECVESADIVVTATYASEPLIRLDMLKRGAHINAVGAGINHHSELADDVYARSAIYVDTMVSANVELATLGHPILGQVGDVLLGRLEIPDRVQDGFTIFHSMGMAVEDAAVAEMVLELNERQ